MQVELPEYHRPDRNEPDPRLKEGVFCIIYGFKDPEVAYLNGLQCFIEQKITRTGNLLYPVNERWYLCAVWGIKEYLSLREDHLAVLDDSDALVVEKMISNR